MKNFLRWILVLTLILVLVAVGTIACGDDDDDEDMDIAPPVTTSTQPPATSTGKDCLTVDNTLQELYDNPDTWAVFVNVLGEELAGRVESMLEALGPTPMVELFGMSESMTPEMKDQIIADLAAVCEAGPPTTSQPPAAGGLTIDASIGEILDAPGGEAILRECLGDEIVDNPQMSMAFGMNLPTIAPMSGGVITDEMVACVKEGLQALASGGTGEPPAACLSQDSTLDELTGDPGARAILLEYISEAQIDMIAQAGMGGITLREGAEMGGSITPAMADEIDAKLAALCGGEPPAATTEPPAACLTIDSKMGDLLDNPDAKTILEKHLPADIMAKAGMVRGFALPVLAPQSEDVTDEMLEAIAADLEALCGGEPAGELLTIDSKMGDLLDNPDAKAILEKYLPPDIMAKAGMVRSFTLPELAPMSEDVTDEMLEAIAADLEALGAYATPVATTSAPPETTSELAGKPVKIGVVSAWTGAMAVVGLFVDQWEAVVEQQVKDMGGILDGRPVEFVNVDDESTTTGVVSAVTKLALDDDVVCIAVAGESNASMIAASNAAEDNQILHFTPGTFDLSDYEYTVNSAWAPDGMDNPYIDFVINVLKPDTVAYLLSQSEENENVRIPKAEAAFEDAGIEVLDVIAVPLDVQDFSPYITKVRGMEPDVLIFGIDNAPWTVAQQLPGLGGWGDTIVMGMSARITQISTKQYPAAVGWYSMASYVPGMAEIYPAAGEMEEAWHKVQGDTEITAPLAWLYTNFWAAIHAIELADTTDREDVVDAARSGELEFDCPYGHFKVNPDGTNTLQASIVRLLENDMFEIVQSPE